MTGILLKLAFTVTLLVIGNAQGFNFRLGVNKDPNGARTELELGQTGKWRVHAGGSGDKNGGGGGANVEVGREFAVYGTGWGTANGGGGSDVRIGNPNPRENWGNFGKFIRQWGPQEPATNSWNLQQPTPRYNFQPQRNWQEPRHNVQPQSDWEKFTEFTDILSQYDRQQQHRSRQQFYG